MRNIFQCSHSKWLHSYPELPTQTSISLLTAMPHHGSHRILTAVQTAHLEWDRHVPVPYTALTFQKLWGVSSECLVWEEMGKSTPKRDPFYCFPLPSLCSERIDFCKSSEDQHTWHKELVVVCILWGQRLIYSQDELIDQFHL